MRVFAYPRFNLSEKEIEYLIYQEILPFFLVIEVKPGSLIIKQDPSDDYFIRCAESSGSNIIISGDQHLISLKNYGKIKIISPSEFLKSKI
jgi:predicted nucleic acid-binding protein